MIKRKYHVKLQETVSYDVEVEAEDGEKAEELAAEIWAKSANPTADFKGFGHGVTALYHEILREDGTVIHRGDPDDPERNHDD